MKGAIAVRQPVQVIVFTTAISHTAYTELDAALNFACSAVRIVNGTDVDIKLAVGASGSEVDKFIQQKTGTSSDLLPINIAKGARITAKAPGGADSSTGSFGVEFYQ